MCVYGWNVGAIARGTAGGREPVGLFFAIDFVVYLLLNGTSQGARDDTAVSWAERRYYAYHHPLAIQLFVGRNVGVMRTTTHARINK